MYGILDKVNTPADIKGLDMEQLRQLCAEIRDYMVQCCATNPGHLASSLGTVEIIVALHYLYDTPKDKIVFDVGHQAYAHKILTGRKEAFRENRTMNGISGFPKMSESPYDSFGVGHSSTSISAALGLAEAARLKGTGEKVAAIIGDGALTGGLALEGLNNAGDSLSDLLIILNDNNHSIDDSTGGLHNHLLRITTHPFYNRIKQHVWDYMGETRTRNFFQRWVRSFKSWLVKSSGGDLFESFGLRYFGPVDGNDIEQVISALRKIRDIKGPRVLHCITVKGKGYGPAEKDPTTWHAPGRFDPATGERLSAGHARDRYQDVFGEVLVELALIDERVVGVTPAMATGCGMNLLAKKCPGRFYDVGIEEEHAVTFSAGLTAGGMRPFCNIYSSFSQRAYDQIVHDVALQGLPVVFCFDRAGLVGEDGATHHGALDIAAYRSVPGAVIAVPKDETELKLMMYTGLKQNHGPFIIRYPRGMGEGAAWREAKYRELPVGKGELLRKGSSRLAIIAAGPMCSIAMKAAEEYEAKGGEAPYIYNIRFVKPLDEVLMEEVAATCGSVLTLEDGTIKGGLFGAVTEYMAEHNHSMEISGIGIPDEFIVQGRQSEERSLCGLDTDNILKQITYLTEKD